MGGAAVPGAQSVLVPRRQRRRAEGPAAARSRRPRRHPTARRHHREGRDAGRADRRRTGHSARPVDQSAAGDVRPRGDRRRSRGPGRRGVRRLGGPEDGADRERPPPAGRRAAARRSRTTSASRRAFPVPSSPRRPAGRPRSSAPRSSRPGRRSDWRSTESARHASGSTDGSTIGAQAVILATGVDYRQLRAKGCWQDYR